MKAPNFQEGSMRVNLLLRAVGLKGRQVVEAIKVTTEGLIEDLKAEIKKGNHKEVLAFLGTNAILWGKSALLDNLTRKMAARLMLRLGLPGIIAAGVVAILVPFVLLKLRKKAVVEKDAGAFLKTFDLKENEELEGKVQLLLEENPALLEEQAPEKAATDQVTEEPVK
jgi:hypothetical protein